MVIITSIHASSIGSDSQVIKLIKPEINFNPRFQYRKRHEELPLLDYIDTTSIHASSIGSDPIL